MKMENSPLSFLKGLFSVTYYIICTCKSALYANKVRIALMCPIASDVCSLITAEK